MSILKLGGWGFDPQLGHSKDCKNGTHCGSYNWGVGPPGAASQLLTVPSGHDGSNLTMTRTLTSNLHYILPDRPTLPAIALLSRQTFARSRGTYLPHAASRSSAQKLGSSTTTRRVPPLGSTPTSQSWTTAAHSCPLGEFLNARSVAGLLDAS